MTLAVSDGHSTMYTIGSTFAAVNNGQPYVDVNGVWWKVTREEGWSSPSENRAEVLINPVTDGQDSSNILANARTIILGGTIRAPNQLALQAAMDQAAAVLTSGDRTDTLTVAEPHLRRHLTVRRSDQRWAIAKQSPFVATFLFNLIADDTLRYGDVQSLSTALPSSTGGISWPGLSWPLAWNSTTVSGVLHFDNPGATAPVFARIDGPVVGPYVRHVGSGAELVLSSSYSLGAGAWLAIDMANRQVLENGQASRNQFLLERGFFAMDPGPNDIIFGAQVYNSSALLTISYSPAYP